MRRSILRSTAPLAVLSLLLLVACGRPEPGSSGGRTVIQNKGSDTLVNVAQAWAEAYKDVDPGVAIAVSGGGSGTGISAMINGTVDIANASRKMKEKELEMARANGDTLPIRMATFSVRRPFATTLKTVFAAGAERPRT